jgi:hypothetical protein
MPFAFALWSAMKRLKLNKIYGFHTRWFGGNFVKNHAQCKLFLSTFGCVPFQQKTLGKHVQHCNEVYLLIAPPQTV